MIKLLTAVVAALVVLAGWRLWRSLLHQVMGSLGVDLSTLTQVERMNFVMTLLLGIIGLVLSGVGVYLAGLAVDLGKKANDLTAKATIIAEKQDRYFEDERAKRAIYQIARPDLWGGKLDSYPVWLTNTGRRASRGYWYLGVPKRVADRIQVVLAPGFRELAVNSNADTRDNPFDDPQFSHFHDDFLLRKFEVVDELPASDRRLGGNIVVKWTQGDEGFGARSVLWFTQTPDARFPEKGVRGFLLAKAGEHWIKYADPETARKIKIYVEGTDDDLSWLSF